MLKKVVKHPSIRLLRFDYIEIYVGQKTYLG